MASPGPKHLIDLRLWRIEFFSTPRNFVFLIINILPTYKLLTGVDYSAALGLSYGALLYACLWHLLLIRRQYVHTFAFFSTMMDVMCSGTLKLAT